MEIKSLTIQNCNAQVESNCVLKDAPFNYNWVLTRKLLFSVVSLKKKSDCELKIYLKASLMWQTAEM